MSDPIIDEKRPRSNVPEYSVADLAFSLKKTLEDTYSRVRVRGELSRVSIPGSGHMYSSLKDDRAVIDAVCWKGTLSKLSVRPEEGLEVIVTGRISTYPQRSNYQLVIETMELAGEGALLKMLEQRKKQLAAEGLFAPERKRSLPVLPDVIGVITSPTGAVIRDILHRLDDRFPRHVIVWPVLVQGDGAAEQVAAAIDGFQDLDKHQGGVSPDVLIVARGGGSLEDLMPFNEKVVVRAVARSSIPVISAVGHETDTTLCDYAADVRAPTPTGAAEIVVPVRAQLQAQIMDDGQRLFSGVSRLLSDRKNKLDALSGRLGDPARLLEGYMQRVDHVGQRLGGVFSHYLGEKRRFLIERAADLRHPRDRIRESQMALDRRVEQLIKCGAEVTRHHNVAVEHAGKMLEAYSFKNVLNRGFTVVRDKKGVLVSDTKALKNGAEISIEFKDAKVDALVGQHLPTKKFSKVVKKKPKSRLDSEQRSLF